MHSVAISPQHPDWYLAFDTDRDAGVATRKRVYGDLAAARSLISGSHLPFPSLGHLKAVDTAFAYVPAPWMWA